MAEQVGQHIPAPVGSPEWEQWMAACRAVLRIAPRTWPAYLLEWQLRRLYEAGLVVAEVQPRLWERIVEEARTGRPQPPVLSDG